MHYIPYPLTTKSIFTVSIPKYSLELLQSQSSAFSINTFSQQFVNRSKALSLLKELKMRETGIMRKYLSLEKGHKNEN
jgi:NADPH-dependent 7-cyano-7-deazaguanine reductase QueF-like protein